MRADQISLLYFGRGGLLSINLSKNILDLAKHDMISVSDGLPDLTPRGGAQTRSMYFKQSTFLVQCRHRLLEPGFDSGVNNTSHKEERSTHTSAK